MLDAFIFVLGVIGSAIDAVRAKAARALECVIPPPPPPPRAMFRPPDSRRHTAAQSPRDPGH